MTTEKELHMVFGTGPAGLSLAAELLQRGKRVRLVNRSGQAAAPEGSEIVAGDASKLEVLTELSQGATTIYNCTHAPYENWPEILPRLQENMIEAAAATGARLIVIDTLYLYGPTGGKPMTEETPHLAVSRKGRLRGELAWGYLQAHRVGKAKVALARAADFFGPGVTNSALGQYIFPAVLNNQPALTLGDIDLPHSYNFMPDIARALATLGENETAFGREWLLPVAPVVSTREVLDIIGQQRGQPAQVFNVPSVAEAQAAGIFDDTFAREYVELFYQYTEPQIVDSSRIEREFGLKATPLEEALARTIDWYQTQAQSVQ
ncbi:MAG: NAD(P)H-binding protein [Chloroflexi bacterium]|nr:NAD(P)H-binding protein [Chloroflexota bacterium]OJV88459.1 MAG: epimerase [Chloroflexi bacterium 54-19]